MLKSCTFILTTVIIFAGSSVNAEETSAAYEHLKDLEVFVGTWVGTAMVPEGGLSSDKYGDRSGKPVTITDKTRWAPGKCAQVSEITFAPEGAPEILALAVTAWDQGRNQIRFTEYTTEKGTWSGVWSKEGKTWTVIYDGIDLDGRKCTGKRVITFIDKDHYTLREEDRTKNGESLPPLEFHFSRK